MTGRTLRDSVRRRAMKTTWKPLTADTWTDLEGLFGSRGACGGCWCMAWRRKPAEFQAGKGEENRLALRKLASGKVPPGLLLYRGGEAVGWCSVAPRDRFVRLAASRVWKEVDDRPVWSVSCFFVKKGFRNQGLSVELLKAALQFAKERGATIVEGYPQAIEGRLPDAFVWTGLEKSYRRAGFEEVARRSPAKPIMRREVRGPASRKKQGGWAMS